MVWRMDLKKYAHLFLGARGWGAEAGWELWEQRSSVFPEGGWVAKPGGGERQAAGGRLMSPCRELWKLPPLGYPIPHKSLAEDWGFREAWQNRCIKQEQTSHTFLCCLLSRGVVRGSACLHGTSSVHISTADNGDLTPSSFNLSIPLFLKRLPNVSFTSHWRNLGLKKKERFCITFVWNYLQIFFVGPSIAVGDLIEKEWAQRDARKQLITHVAGRFWCRHRGRCGWRCHVFRRSDCGQIQSALSLAPPVDVMTVVGGGMCLKQVLMVPSLCAQQHVSCYLSNN